MMLLRTAVLLSLLLMATLCHGKYHSEDDDEEWMEENLDDTDYDDYDESGDDYSDEDEEWDSDYHHHDQYKHRPSKAPCPSESPIPPTPSPTCPAKSSPSPSPTCPKKTSPSASPSIMVPSRSPSVSPSPSMMPSVSPSPSGSTTPSPSPSASPPASPSGTPSSSPSVTPSPSTTPSPSSSPSPSTTPTPTPTPSASPSTSVSPILSTPGPSPLASASPVPQTVCPQPLLGVEGGFSALVFGNSSSAGSELNSTQFVVDLAQGDFEGRTAVNGGLRLRSFGLFQNSPCTANLSQQATLVVNGPVDAADTRLLCGNMVVSNLDDIIRAPSLQTGNSITVSEVVDFGQLRSNLTQVSASLCALTNATPADTTIFGDVRLRASGAATEVFSIDVAALARTGFMRITNADSAVVQSVVVNVLGEGTARFSNFFVDTGAIPKGRFTWNVCSASQVVIQNFLFPSTLLAPQAAVTLQRAQVVGSVVSATLTGSGGGQINAALCP